MKNLSIILLGLLISIGPGLMAQKPTPFASKTANADKISVKFDFPAEGRTSKKGGGYSANVDLLDPKPKKVALISFYLYDPACGKASKSSTTTHVYSSASVWTTPQALAQTHIDGFYEKSLAPLVAGFKEYGIDLLTPDQYLDTQEKKDFFYGFNQESGKKEKTTRTQIGYSVAAKGGTLKICPYDEGYRPFFVTNEPLNESMLANFVNTGIGGANRKMTSSLGYDLAKAIDVDAVVVCYIVTRKPKSNKEDYVVDAVSLFMFGPNPKSDGPDDKNRGQFYCGTRFFAKQLQFANEKTGVTSYDNIGNVMTALAKKNANWVINRAKK
ncbi:MAG: hypothetical protein K8R37_11920 [Bacteroidales bacterium]|nr:hypothetical protein [Bacteroidales bacterium]